MSLHVTEGEMLLLAGCSGCGKSTLIKAVSGLLNTAGAGELDGKIYLNNKDTAEMTPEDIGILVGTVYQSPDDQLFAMTVSDEVGFALENQGLDESELDLPVLNKIVFILYQEDKGSDWLWLQYSSRNLSFWF